MDLLNISMLACEKSKRITVLDLKGLPGQTDGCYLFTGGGESIQDDCLELWLAAKVHMVPHLAQ